ncbi:hypothetical protein SAMN04515647_1829 [Cohaesibacter sp. ES.047]|uniref:hypothetical protein n=1 Tax=Cohaesibacter sp. ES.047 TaxID=1798205 RepID=UPI000BB68BC4|nr:hypothetical protein [Cohaesibacter sp. ES.047]SNY91600.1 hypothetical protein SAMN04515647_1829 [Cohaesibacter sp. ES.047]
MDRKTWAESQLLGLNENNNNYQPDKWSQNRGISVRTFRQILIWPLFVELDRQALKNEKAVHEDDLPQSLAGLMSKIAQELQSPKDKSASSFSSAWRKEEDLLEHIEKRSEESAAQTAETNNEAENKRRKADCIKHENDKYAEFVFFHEVIQDFLYQRRPISSTNRPNRDAVSRLHLFKRDDITQLKVKLAHDEGKGLEITLDVDRCNLYLASTGIVLLALEVSWNEGSKNSPPVLSLADVESLTDQLRRCYSPFVHLPFKLSSKADEEESYRSGLCPEQVDLIFSPSRTPILKQPKQRLAVIEERRQALDDSGKHKRSPQLFPHWQELIAPFNPVNVSQSDQAYMTTIGKGMPFTCRHIMDERIPIMTFLSLSKQNCDGPSCLSTVSRGDWVRLCFADGSGADPMPYNPLFLRDFEEKHCYDRFFLSPATPDKAVRLMFASYAFTTVGAGDYFDNILQEHFRRHYFQMSLLAYLEHSTLLGFSKRLTNVVASYEEDRNDKRPDPKVEQQFHRAISDLKREFLLYTHQYRFTGISNQVQPIEMYNQWREVIGLNSLYEDVKQELDTATDFLLAIDQQQQTDSAANLNVLASLGLAASLIFSFLGMNILFQKNPINPFWNDNSTFGSQSFSSAIWVDLFYGAIAFLVISGIIYAVLYRLVGSSGRTIQERFTSRALKYGIIISLFAAIFLGLWIKYPISPSCEDSPSPQSRTQNCSQLLHTADSDRKRDIRPKENRHD